MMKHALITRGALVFGITLGFAVPAQAAVSSNMSDAIQVGILQGVITTNWTNHASVIQHLNLPEIPQTTSGVPTAPGELPSGESGSGPGTLIPDAEE